MRPALAAARTDPSSTHPGRWRKAYTAGSVVTLAAASRVTSARAEKTVTFRIAEVTATVLGSAGTGAARLAGTNGEDASPLPAVSAGLPPGAHAAVAAPSAAKKIHARCPIARLTCISPPSGRGHGSHRGTRP